MPSTPYKRSLIISNGHAEDADEEPVASTSRITLDSNGVNGSSPADDDAQDWQTVPMQGGRKKLKKEKKREAAVRRTWFM